MTGNMTIRLKGKIGSNVTIVEISDSTSVGGSKVNLSGNGKIQDILPSVSPAVFAETVNMLSPSHLKAAEELGFGNLNLIGCTSVYDDVCRLMVANLEPRKQKVMIHGKSFEIRATHFARFMGVVDGGDNVLTSSGQLNDARLLSLRKYLAIGHGEVHIRHVKTLLLERRRPDDTFKIAYTLYALSTLLCPNGSHLLDQSLVFPLLDTDNISRKNWATFCHTRLMESVKTMQINEYRQQSACMVFLQVFYFDAVANGSKWVDNTICPLCAWKKKDVMKLLLSVEKNGVVWQQSQGHTIPKNKKQCRRSECQTKNMESDVAYSRDDGRYLRLYEKVMYMEPKIKEVDGKMDDLKNLVISFKKEVVSEVVDRVVSCIRKGMTENRGNSKGFDIKFDANCTPEFMESEAQSNNPRCGNLVKKRRNNPFPDEVIQLKGGIKDNGIQSRCSRSPNGSNKWSRKRKIANSKSLQARRLMFSLNKYGKAGQFNRPKVRVDYKIHKGMQSDVWGGPFLIQENTSNETLDILNFLFMERPLTRHEAKFDNKIIASCDGFSATRSDLEESLNPGHLLDDTVINIFASYLNEDNSVNWFLPTYVGAAVGSPHKMIDDDKWIKTTFSLCKLDRFRGRIKAVRQIFIPMHDKINDKLGHWYLLVVSPQSGHAIIADSAPDCTRESIRVDHARRVLNLLDKVFEEEMWLEMPVGFKFAILPWETGETFPIQKNGFDCGLYVIRNMQHYKKDWDAKYVSEDHRASLAVECVSHPRNEVDNVKKMIQQCLRPTNGKIEETSVPIVVLSSDCS